MKPIAVAVTLLLLGACGNKDIQRAADVSLPATDDIFFSVQPDATGVDIVRLVDAGLTTKEKGPDAAFFVVIRAGDRHAPEIKDAEFHVVVGAGVRMPKGSMRIRRKWIASGMIDGTNEEFQTLGIAIMVERGATRPFVPEVVSAVTKFCGALTARVPIHPDCIVGMGDVPYTNDHPADADEKELAAAARARVSVPKADSEATIKTKKGPVKVTYETRATSNGRRIGMMMRRRFDGKNRGMLFIYPNPFQRAFWMRNCFIQIDVAYILDGKIEQIETMAPAAGFKADDMSRYPSDSYGIKYCLEMPGGWFGNNGVAVGDEIQLR